MHASSMRNMQWVIDNCLNNLSGKVLDVGSCVAEAQPENYRRLFNNTHLYYRGCDVVAGENVDLIMPTPYEIPSQWGKFEVIISGQVAEHVQDIYKWLTTLRSALKPQGSLVIISPFIFQIHRYPVDCWRILPDGYNWLLGDFLGMDIIYTGIRENDVVAIAKLK